LSDTCLSRTNEYTLKQYFPYIFSWLARFRARSRIIETLIEPSALAAITESPSAEISSPEPLGRAVTVGRHHTTETVLTIRPWTKSLLSFRTTRAQGFRFTPGHYARLGLDDGTGEVVWRPFSVASAAHDEHLEFFAVLVPGGKFSDLLADTRAGDTIRVEKASYGFLTIDRFAPGAHLWLLASGTGLGPFLSILHDPATWQAYDTVIVVHSVRYACELAYREDIPLIPRGELIAAAPERLRYIPVVTRERVPGALPARIPRLIEDRRLERAARVELEPQRSRIMVCGNPEMSRELRRQLTERGFRANRRAAPGHIAFENYWTGTTP
jgi:ferredoxin--NADP+ reductase